MAAPITTTIINNTEHGRTIHWTAKAPIWLEGNGSVTIDYEPCSVANNKQLISILAECASGDISLVLNVRQQGGVYTQLQYNPADTATAQKTVAATPPASPELTSTYVQQIDQDEQRHIVTTQQEGMAKVAKHMGLTTETVAPPTAISVTSGTDEQVAVEGATKEGFQTEIPKEMANTVIATDANSPAPVSFETEFARLVDAKDWQGALELLMQHYGEDNIKFTARTIMQLKTLNKIKDKYGLV